MIIGIWIVCIMVFNLGAFGRCTSITFVDSTMIPVCHNLRRYANKVFKGIATDGKGTMDYPLLMVWGGGVFTLHLYCIKHSVIPNWGYI